MTLAAACGWSLLRSLAVHWQPGLICHYRSGRVALGMERRHAGWHG